MMLFNLFLIHVVLRSPGWGLPLHVQHQAVHSVGIPSFSIQCNSREVIAYEHVLLSLVN